MSKKYVTPKWGIYNKCFLVSKQIDLDAFIAVRSSRRLAWKLAKLIKHSGIRRNNAKPGVIYTFISLYSAFEHME